MENKYTYTLTITEKQVTLIKDALEEYFRIRLNQWCYLAEDLALKNIDLSRENPKHKEIFEKFLHDRDAVQKIFECAGRVLWDGKENNKSEEQLIAEDIWQVIKHQLWQDKIVKNSENLWCVDAYEPLRMSQEPLPIIEKVEKTC